MKKKIETSISFKKILCFFYLFSSFFCCVNEGGFLFLLLVNVIGFYPFHSTMNMWYFCSCYLGSGSGEGGG